MKTRLGEEREDGQLLKFCGWRCEHTRRSDISLQKLFDELFGYKIGLDTGLQSLDHRSLGLQAADHMSPLDIQFFFCFSPLL